MTGLANKPNSQYRILVVDDDAAVRKALSKALTLHGYAVSAAESGEQALAILRSAPYTLMVLDMQMPGIDGVEVMRHTRDIQPHLLILVLTAHASLDYAIASIKMHAVDFLQKPVSAHTVGETVDKLIQAHIDRMKREQLIDIISDAMGTLNAPNGQDEPEETQNGDILYLPPISLNKSTKTVVVDNSHSIPIALSDGESAVLAYLMENTPNILTSRQLAKGLWGQNDLDEITAQGLVRPYISRLRRKIPILRSNPPILRTFRGQGYAFIPHDVMH